MSRIQARAVQSLWLLRGDGGGAGGDGQRRGMKRRVQGKRDEPVGGPLESKAAGQAETNRQTAACAAHCENRTLLPPLGPEASVRHPPRMAWKRPGRSWGSGQRPPAQKASEDSARAAESWGLRVQTRPGALPPSIRTRPQRGRGAELCVITCMRNGVKRDRGPQSGCRSHNTPMACHQ